MKYIKLIILFPIIMYNYMWNRCVFIIFGKNEFRTFPTIHGRIVRRGKGKLVIGKNNEITSDSTTNPVGLGEKSHFYSSNNAIIRIGDNVGITNSLIYAIESITLEDGVLIGGGCQIYDSDFHSLDPNIRNSGTDIFRITKPVILKNKCFIGANCIILKGVVIGKNSVVAAGSVVTKSIPDNEVWGGNPAKFIKQLSY